MSSNRLYQVALNLVPGIGDVLIKHLVSYCGSPKAVFDTPKSKLQKVPGIGAKNAQAIASPNILPEAEKELKTIEQEGAHILFFTDPEYPERLKQVYDAPALIYYKGQPVLNQDKVVAIVGTRKATNYGRRMVEEIIEGLKPFNPVIVSGLAYGIDIHAHKFALQQNLVTVAVLASGLDIIYPYSHRNVAMEMTDRGAIISENKFGTKPDAHLFPARNRIIAGSCDALLVVEAASRGGALITAEFANSYDREVMAIPGDLNRPFSQGCNDLIKNHKAHIYTGPKDLEYVMNWDLDESDQKNAKKLHNYDSKEFPAEELGVLNLLSENIEGMVIDELSWRTQISISRIASVLLNLEFKGLIRLLPGKKYVIK
jgi:DNA processing protein